MGEAIISRRGGGIGDFFGDGSDGVFNSTGNVTIPVTAHSGIAIKQYTSFTLNAGHTLTTDNPCRGFILYSQGDVVIDGTIDMSQKAGLAPNGEIVPMVLTKKDSLGTKTIDKYFKLTTVLQALKGGAGGNGGYGGGYSGYGRSIGGTGGVGRQNLGGFGGGGGGGNAVNGSYKGGNGGNIDLAEIGSGLMNSLQNYIFTDSSNSVEVRAPHGSNGSGGGGSSYGFGYVTFAYGGKCNGGGGGGGGGAICQTSSGYASGSPGAHGNYAGGFILIITKGNIIISGTGSIKANGGNGGNGGRADGESSHHVAGGGGGGGSGGGVIALFYKGIFTNNGILEVNGGIGGSGGTGYNQGEAGGSGTSGSVGTIHIQQL